MIGARVRLGLLAGLGVVTMSLASCKRDVDVIIPDSGAAPTVTTAAPSASATTAATNDTVEPLATLSSGRVPTPYVAPPPRPGDAGAAAASAATGLPTAPPTGLPTGLPTGVPTTGLPTAPTGLPTAPPTVAPTAPAGAQPAECEAAKLMRKLGRTNEAETLRVKCVEKGGKDPFI